MKDYSYFHKGIKKFTTDSAFLVSSSKYLNNPQMRDWLTTHFLRRNSPGQPVPADATLGLVQALDQMRDVDHALALIEREKKINPKFAAWMEKGYLCRRTKDDFAKYPADSFGGRFYIYLRDHGFELNLGGKLVEPKNGLEFIFARIGQIHDLEHLITGGGFNSMGEILINYAHNTSLFQHVSAELAQILAEITIFANTRLQMRSSLHYPTTYLTTMHLVHQGITVGLTSESLLMAPYEDVFHLPVPEAREKLGVRNAFDFPSEVDNEVYLEERLPTDAEELRIGRPDLLPLLR